MTIEIKTSTLDSVRNTYEPMRRRFGDKPATRYQEASYDIQATDNFHYKPLWSPEYQLNDARRTVIKMEDWYVLRDPRQFYYGVYVQSRAKMQEAADNNYQFFEKRRLGDLLDSSVKQKLIEFVLPFRHVDHTANLNNVYASAYGVSTIFTQALLYYGMDRLGVAQYLSRMGLILDGNTGDSLQQAKQHWLHGSHFQPLRKLCEESLTIDDWYEVFLLQDLLIDTLHFELMYHQLDNWFAQNGAQDVSMLTEFMQVWFKDSARWVDAVIKATAAASDENKVQLESWIDKWCDSVELSLAAVAEPALSNEAMANAVEALNKRLTKVGLFV